MISQGLPEESLILITTQFLSVFENDDAWLDCLKTLGIKKVRHTRIITEGALIGSLVAHGFNLDMVIVSDDAGQFNILNHALCWVHAERLINKLIGLTEEQKQAVQDIRAEIWELYASLKEFKAQPGNEKKTVIKAKFDEIFTKKTCFASLNNALKRIHRNKRELLRVLDFPDTPLHNNLSENDIQNMSNAEKSAGRPEVIWDDNAEIRSQRLKKTCRKLKISFWEYLKDRLSSANVIPDLSDIITIKALQLSVEL